MRACSTDRLQPFDKPVCVRGHVRRHGAGVRLGVRARGHGERVRGCVRGRARVGAHVRQVKHKLGPSRLVSTTMPAEERGHRHT